MAQKFYIASNGNSHLTLSDRPGEVTESLIVENIGRMMALDDDAADRPWTEMKRDVMKFFQENLDQILQMAHLHEALVEISEEEADEIQDFTFEEWLAWEFQGAE